MTKCSDELHIDSNRMSLLIMVLFPEYLGKAEFRQGNFHARKIYFYALNKLTPMTTSLAQGVTMDWDSNVQHSTDMIYCIA